MIVPTLVYTGYFRNACVTKFVCLLLKSTNMYEKKEIYNSKIQQKITSMFIDIQKIDRMPMYISTCLYDIHFSN